jgi:hypothetical protein
VRVPFGVWVVAGVLVGALGASALVASGALDREVGADDPDDEQAVQQEQHDQAAQDEQQARAATAFIDAWERSRLGTYVVELSLHRTFADGTGFTADRSIAQRPPDRLERSFGSITARLDGDVVRCRVSARQYRCTSGPAGRSYRALVRDEVDTLRTYFEGPVPLYVVTADGGCFDLRQERPLPAPPYGTAARFCFDDETGATTSIRVERDEATDVTEATEVRTEVRDRDLQPPDDGDPAAAGPPSRDEG